jgi:hypothetical protein
MKGRKATHVGHVLPEQEGGWSLMIFCARATRGRGLPSLGLLARLGVPVDGRVRKLRAVEDQSGPIPREKTRKFGGRWRDSWHGLCARRAPTMKRWSPDARNGDHTSRLAGYG